MLGLHLCTLRMQGQGSRYSLVTELQSCTLRYAVTLLVDLQLYSVRQKDRASVNENGLQTLRFLSF